MSDFNNSTDSLLVGENGSSEIMCPWIFQGYSDTCAIRSQEIVLRDFGIEVPQERLMEISEQMGWYHNEGANGTSPEDVGKLLQMAGVGCHSSENNNVFDLINELSQGHRVIVGVDSGELWAQTFDEQFNEFMEDQSGFVAADHALIVAGVEVDPNDINNTKVILTDPGTGSVRVEYSLNDFLDAWQDSNFFMCATDEAAPYQFNPETGCEEPSYFNTDFAFNDFVIDNGFELSTDSLQFPENEFVPVDTIFTVDYDNGIAYIIEDIDFFPEVEVDPFPVVDPDPMIDLI